ARAGLGDALLSDPERYIPYRNVLLAFEEAARSLEVSNFGLRLAARQDMTFLGALALAIQSAASVRDGLMVAARNMHYHT
ncbi:AraC family transcriptional regulator ligand-binding domain-containing protein, partial [Salmonella enterica]|uniref:AraC family transcriptional regulator ligand-binding domain-containing protein n=1 Tax=Salmonella enterica TaxID=28901 RepID=UPI003CFA5752